MLVLSASPVWAQMSLSDFKKKVKSDDKTEREDAYAALDSYQDRDFDTALKALEAEHKKQARDYRRLAGVIQGYISGYNSKISDKEAAIKAWETAADKAGTAIFDTVAFPNPTGPVSGPYKGFDFVDEQVRAMRAQYDLVRGFVDADLRKIIAVPRRSAREAVEKIRAAIEVMNEQREVLRRHEVEAESLEPVSKPARAMVFAKILEWGPAITLYNGKKPDQVDGISRNAPSGGSGPRPPANGGGFGQGQGQGQGQGPQAGGAGMPDFGGSYGPSYGVKDNPFWKNADGQKPGEGARVDTTRRGSMYGTGSGNVHEDDYADEWDEEPKKDDKNKKKPGDGGDEWDKSAAPLAPQAFFFPMMPGQEVTYFGSEDGDGFSGYERALFFFLYCALVDEFNAQVECDPITEAVRKAIAYNNDYRASLRMAPLQIHPQLNEAINKHLQEEAEYAYFSHEGATPETKTMSQRIERTGYPLQRPGENLSQSDLRSGMDRWRWDGGHHRNLVNPGHHHIGAGEHGDSGSGMNIGAGGKLGMPILHFRR